MRRTETEGRGITWSMAAAMTVTTVFVLSNAPTPLYVSWQREWGFSSGTLTMVFACYMVGLVGSLLVAGRLADRYGRRVVLIPALIAAVLSGLLFLLAQGVAWLLAARLLAGISVGGAVTAGMAAVVDLAPEGRRRIGGLIASASMVLGAGLGPLLAGITARNSDSPQIWVFTLVTALAVIALGVGLLLPLPHPDRSLPSGEGGPWRWPSPPRNRRRELVWGAATFAPGITATSFVLSLGPSVLAGPLGVGDPLVAGLIACVMFLVATGVQFAVGRLSTRTHLAVSSVAAIASMALLAGAVTVTPVWPLFLTSALLAGAAQGLGQLAGLTLIATRVPHERRAESNAALNIAGYVPAGALPVATGHLADATGLGAAVVVFAVVLGVFAALALPIVRLSTARHPNRSEKRRQKEHEMEKNGVEPPEPGSTLVIVAHPDLGSSRVNSAWVRALTEEGGTTVRVLAEERGVDGFDVRAEQRALAAHERIVLQFPFRWYGAPPILAEWLEVALERGWAYGPGGHALEGKELSIAVSTWSRANDYTVDGRYHRVMSELTSPFETIAARVGMRYRPGHFLHGVGDLTDERLADAARDYARWSAGREDGALRKV